MANEKDLLKISVSGTEPLLVCVHSDCATDRDGADLEEIVFQTLSKISPQPMLSGLVYGVARFLVAACDPEQLETILEKAREFNSAKGHIQFPVFINNKMS